MRTPPSNRRWKQDALLQSSMERGDKAGLAQMEQLVGKSRREILQAMVCSELPSPPIDMTLLEVGYGWAVFRGIPLAQHHNLLGTVHGGWFATLMNSALCGAVQTTLQTGRGYTMAELNTKILRFASEKTGPLRAVGEVIQSGGLVATAQARVEDENGKLYAQARTTCFVYDVPLQSDTP